MSKKALIIVFLVVIAAGAGGYYLGSSSSASNKTSVQTEEEKQLYTCGMHPDVISEEPGDCPICGMRLMPMKKGAGTKTAKSGERKIIYWRAPMNPSEIYDKPGKSRMGMDLVPVYEDEVSGEGVVSIDPVVQQNMNVKVEMIESKTLHTEVVTNGILRTDERREYIATTKTGGWIEKLYVNFTGQKVKKGEKLIEIYSPQLVAAEQELLTALSYKSSVGGAANSDILGSGEELVKNAIRKLELLDVTQKEIDELIQTKELKTEITLYAPFDGTVIHKGIIEGQKINPGTPLLKIADLSNLWLIADIYEFELSQISMGAEAEISFNFLPSKIFRSKVSFIYPTLEAKTRTAKIRFELPNPNDELKPDMFANVVIKGTELSGYPVVPEEAIIRSGRKNIIILALGDGRFKPVEVKLGGYSEGLYQVTEGISDGAKIVTSAQFLIDSESSLKSAIKQFAAPKTDAESDTKKDNTETETKVENHDHSGHTDHAEMQHEMDDMKMDNAAEQNHDMMEHEHEVEHESIVREGVIDVKSIDKNKDGKVFQDMMDWNVISDEAGRCPLCNMKLKEVSIKEAVKNLKENNFQVK